MKKTALLIVALIAIIAFSTPGFAEVAVTDFLGGAQELIREATGPRAS